MLEMRRTIRKERAEREHARDESKRQIQNNLAIVALIFAISGVIVGIIYLITQAG
jgi:F0F1-type ATP synthase assembly protein I